MAKKVLVILGSPRRKGNSAILAAQITKGAKSAQAKVETIYLQEKSIAPCKACFTCQKKGSKGCAIKDDMQEIYPKLLEADAWVIASLFIGLPCRLRPKYSWIDVLRCRLTGAIPSRANVSLLP